MGAIRALQAEGPTRVERQDDSTETYFFGAIGIQKIEEVVENIEENDKDEDDIKSDEMLMMIKMCST